MRAPHRHPNPVPRHRPHPALRGQKPPLTPHGLSHHVGSPGDVDELSALGQAGVIAATDDEGVEPATFCPDGFLHDEMAYLGEDGHESGFAAVDRFQEAERTMSTGIKPLLVLSKIRDILDSFTLAEPALTLSEIRARAGYPTSTIQRLVANMVAEGFLDREDDRYRIGVNLAYWATAATRRLDVLDVITPVLRKIRDETGETSSLFRVERTFRVCVALAETRHAIRREMHVGRILPLHAGSSGKVLMAWDPELAAKVAAGPLEKFTNATVTDPDALLAELKEVRRTGYSISQNERDDGASGVSSPVFGLSGEVIGALGISAPGSRVTEQNCQDWAEILVGAAAQMTRLLGGRLTTPDAVS